MQNELENGTVLFTEASDQSGFIVRDMIKTKNLGMRFQAGHYVNRPMRLPVYKDNGVISHHVDGDDIQCFLIQGYGRSLGEALERASNNLIRASINKAANVQTPSRPVE